MASMTLVLRAAMIERMSALLGEAPAPIRPLPPEEALTEEMKTRHGARLLRAELRGGRLLLVLDAESEALATEAERLASANPPVELVHRANWEMLDRLTASGVIAFSAPGGRLLHETVRHASVAAE